MESSSERLWITLQAQAKLGVGNVAYGTWGKLKSQMQFPEAIERSPGQPMDTLEYAPDQLAWEVAMLAQSSAYLALELQAFAERLSDMPIRCPESTFRRLFDSLVTFRALVDAMHKNYKLSNENYSDGLLPVLSERLVAEIRSMLAQEQVTGSGGSTISTAKVKTSRTADAGGTR